MEELKKLEVMARNKVKMSPGELLMRKFLHAYLQTHNIIDAARFVVPKEMQKDEEHVSKFAWSTWRSRVFQRLLDEHLEEFGKKTKRLKRMTLMVLENSMVEHSGLGGHAARVKAADTMSKILGMQEKKINLKQTSVGTNLLVVPGVSNLEDWEASASKAQEKLRIQLKEMHARIDSNQEH